MAIAAIVVSRNQENHLQAVLAAIKQQQTKVDFTVLVSDYAHQVQDGLIQVPFGKSDNFAHAVASALPALPEAFLKSEDSYLWLLQDDLAPRADALYELVAKLETSSSAAQIAPKIMDAKHPRVIREMGLTLTRTHDAFSPVHNELDQSQHDDREDVLGARLAGCLVSLDKVQRSGGFNFGKFASITADLQLSIRLRLSGFRTIVAPKAKFDDYSVEAQIPRIADFQLKLLYWPAPLAALYALLLPVIAVLRSLWMFFRKQPERVVPEISASFKAFFTAGSLLLARKTLSHSQRKSLRQLRVLYATADEVRQSRHEATAALEESDFSTMVTQTLFSRTTSFFGSGSAWIMGALLILSWQYWPANEAVSAPGLLTLNTNWFDLFARTGASWQPLANGFFAPSDPFNWVLLALGSITFWMPSLSVSILFFVAKALAFAAAWRLFTLVTQKPWLLNLGALAYALWPALSLAQSQGRIAAILTHLLLPIFVFALAKTLGFSGNSLGRQATWGWLATSALTAAALSAAAPSLAPVVATAVLGLAIYRYRKLGYLIWLPVPLVVLWIPTIWYLVFGIFQPLGLLADPGLPLATQKLPAYNLLLGGGGLDLAGLVTCGAVGFLLLVAIMAPLGKRSTSSMWLTVAIAVSVAGAWSFEHIQFVANTVVGQGTGSAWVNGSPHALLALAALLTCFLMVSTLDQVQGNLVFRRLLGGIGYLSVAVLAGFFAITQSQLVYSDGRVVPAIVQAEAKASSQLRMLVLRPEASSTDQLNYTATLVTGDGIQLSDLSVNYRFTLAQLQAKDESFAQIADLSATLIAANGKPISDELVSNRIGYVLVPTTGNAATADLASNLDGVPELQKVGVTEFGPLWRVTATAQVAPKPIQTQDYWSLTKGIQLSVLVIFALLAIPSRRRVQPQNFDDTLEDFTAQPGEDEVQA